MTHSRTLARIVIRHPNGKERVVCETPSPFAVRAVTCSIAGEAGMFLDPVPALGKPRREPQAV